MSFRIVDHKPIIDRLRSDPGFSAINAHPVYGRFGQGYYPAVFGQAYRDASFAVIHDEVAALVFSCSVGADGLGYFGFPARAFVRHELPPGLLDGAVNVAFRHIDTLLDTHQPRRLMFEEVRVGDILSLFGKACLDRNCAGSLRLTGLVDFTNGAEKPGKAPRKSFRSLVNWGRRNMLIVTVDGQNAERSLFQSYQDFHFKVAGRVTRPQESWDAMYACIADGRGALYLGYLEDELVAATLIVDGTETSFYASGVYDRDRFDKPIAHWPLMYAIEQSAARGMKRFDLGHLPMAGERNDKEIAIGYFKRGFATIVANSLVWTTPVPKDN